MKNELLEILRCPRCQSRMQAAAFECDEREIRRGKLTCKGMEPHSFDIEDGIVRFTAGFDHDAVRRELEYENSTYTGSESLRDPKIIGEFPETLPQLWPHTCHFGPDFSDLIDRVQPRSGQWILDIGTGPCWSCRLLAQRGANVIALDVNEADFYGLKTSDILFERHNVFFERILESMTHLPFRDGTIDAITFNASFHHTPDLEQTLRECGRVLRPDGIIAMVNEEFSSIRQRLFARGEVSDTGSHHTIPYGEFERAVRDHDFTAQYFLADHVRKQLGQKLGPVGGLLAWTFEQCPFAIKQLNSALILLRKTTTQKFAAPAMAQPQFESVAARKA
jgi:ubiquinone/menaquinone biosynthesis C-methylase UbiE/uncharacterized protein YbaR (Trm112 family)